MTINQAIDKLFVLYENKDINNFKDVLILKQNLIEMKMTFGGNTLLENSKEVECIIIFGFSDPKKWN